MNCIRLAFFIAFSLRMHRIALVLISILTALVFNGLLVERNRR